MRADAILAPGRALGSARTGSVCLVARTDFCVSFPVNWAGLRPKRLWCLKTIMSIEVLHTWRWRSFPCPKKFVAVVCAYCAGRAYPCRWKGRAHRILVCGWTPRSFGEACHCRDRGSLSRSPRELPLGCPLGFASQQHPSCVVLVSLRVLTS